MDWWEEYPVVDNMVKCIVKWGCMDKGNWDWEAGVDTHKENSGLEVGVVDNLEN